MIGGATLSRAWECQSGAGGTEYLKMNSKRRGRVRIELGLIPLRLPMTLHGGQRTSEKWKTMRLGRFKD